MITSLRRWLGRGQADVGSAEGLAPGDRHYRAWVGPPGNYDLLGALQFTLMIELGLREWHSLLDIGCGSLRAGRLLIPYLRAGGYHGLEPEKWVVDQGIRFELGRDVRRVKRPVFRQNADFRLTPFGRSFDYILAQSIFTHAAGWQIRRCVAEAAQTLAPGGLFVATYLVGKADHPGEDWVYPGVTYFTPAFISQAAADAGLEVMDLAWRHPGVTRPRWVAFGTPEALAAVPEHLRRDS